jgi:hypothetical protein
MNDLYSSDESGPVTWVGAHPIYAVHYLAAGLAASMVVTAILSAFSLEPALAWLSYSSAEVLHGQLWRIATYGLVNPPSLWFVLELLMIVWFGREVEKFFGRRKFFALYAGLYVLPPLVLTLFGLWRATALAGESTGFALFIAFAALHPNAQILFGLLAKWVAWALLGVYALQTLGAHDWVGLISLLATAGFAYGFVLVQMGRLQLAPFSLPLPPSNLPRSRETEPRTHARRKDPEVDAAQETDALLDKIARSGLESLTPKERAKLDAARERLRKKTGR